MDDLILPGLARELILGRYAAAPGNEIESGKFRSPESSARLVANSFGLFLTQPRDLPALPGCESWGWPALSVCLEAIVRFPWRGGHHPCLDVLVETTNALIGIESKRYEPFRGERESELSDAYWRPIWGSMMNGYERLRNGLRDGTVEFTRLNAAQLVKHAFGLRTAVHRPGPVRGKKPILFCIYAEPDRWPGPNGSAVPKAAIDEHRAEIARFAEFVAGDEVALTSCSYRELLYAWSESANKLVGDHAAAIIKHFDV